MTNIEKMYHNLKQLALAFDDCSEEFEFFLNQKELSIISKANDILKQATTEEYHDKFRQA